MSFEAERELEKIRTALAQRKPYKFKQSRLDRYKGELLELKSAGASLSELQYFLREKGVKPLPHVTTISRWIKANIA